MCYADKGNDIFPDAEALAPAYALRLLPYVLLHWQNGFRDVQLWELADSHSYRQDVGCFGVFDMHGKPKIWGALIIRVLRLMGRGEVKTVSGPWSVGNDEVVVGAVHSRVPRHYLLRS